MRLRGVLVVFGLAALVLAAAIAGVVGKTAESLKRDTVARQKIGDNGGAIGKGPSIRVFVIQLPDRGERAFDDRNLEAIVPVLSDVEGFAVLDLKGSSVTDRGITGLSGLRQLEALDVSGTRVTGKGLTALWRLGKLRTIYVSPGQLAEGEMGKLRGTLPRVKILFEGEAVTRPAQG